MVFVFQESSALNQTGNEENISDKTGKFKTLVRALDVEVDPDVRKILQFYLDSHPEKFRTFPSVIGNKVCRVSYLFFNGRAHWWCDVANRPQIFVCLNFTIL